MLNNAAYIIIGIFDAFVVILLGLSLHRQPIAEYWKGIFLICVWSSICSYIIRIILEVPLIDLPCQLIFFVLFYRFGMQYKISSALLIAATGVGAYIPLQLGVASALSISGIVDSSIINQTEGVGVSTIQVSSILAAYVCGFLLKYFNLGWSFIIRPPHDFNLKDFIFNGANKKLLYALIATLIIISLTLISIVHMKTLWIFPFSLVTFATLYYYTARRNEQYD